jgi:acetyl-CoA carboxylase biotin carboxylase subunit
VCRSCKINFIGPEPETIAQLGDKVAARELAKRAGVPVVPGSDGSVPDEQRALSVAQTIGYPIMIKAAAGGGGRGMRIARNEPSLVAGFHAARSEAEAAFGDGTVYLEKFVENPRHIEVQILADRYGKIVHLGERDCSIQRRHQKLIEEAPSPVLTPELRARMGTAAVEACQRVGYSSAGTIEFLLDEDGQFYFMEMNTRIQVEHPVTEMITLADIVRNQIFVAQGQPLWLKQEDVVFNGHSIECRINAEDPETFAPSPGRITAYNAPGGPGVRLDTAAYPGYFVPPYYDSLIAKLIVHARTREVAIARMRRALEVMVVEGIKTTIPLHRAIMEDPYFRAGEYSTRFMEQFFERRKNQGVSAASSSA